MQSSAPYIASQPPGVPVHIGVIVVVGYLLLHMVWARLFYGSYSFVIERAVFLGLSLPCLMLRLRLPLRDLIGSFRFPKRENLWFCLGALALVVVLRMAVHLVADWNVPGSDTEPLNMRNLLYECVLPPLNEEPVFRGLVLLCLLPAFERRRWQLIILSAAIFSACHNLRRVETLIATMILGTILATFFLRTRSLSGSMVLHAVWNAGPFLDFENL